MIDLPQSVIITLILRALLCGAVLGVFYDVIRALKMLFGVGYFLNSTIPSRLAKGILAHAITFVTDLVFWLTAGLLSIALIYEIGGGVFRGITYIGLTAGFLIYYFTLGRLVLKLSAILVKAIKKAVSKVVRLVLIPIKRILLTVISLYHLTIGKILGKIRLMILQCREKRRKGREELTVLPIEDDRAEGKEDFVYVDGRTGFKKCGRISFGGERMR